MEDLLISAGISAVTLVLSGGLSWYLAHKYGDMAAIKATRAFHQEESLNARIVAIRSLINELTRIRMLALSNMESKPHQASVRMPLTAFETAFYSREPVLLLDEWGSAADPTLIGSITNYLTLASEINALVDLYIAHSPGAGHASPTQLMEETTRDISAKSQIIPRLLVPIEKGLTDQLEANMLQLHNMRNPSRTRIWPRVRLFRGKRPIS